MKGSETNMSMGLNRMNGLLAWWGIPNTIGADAIEARSKRFQLLVAELSTLFSDASSSQVQAISDTNDRFSQALQELLSARQAPELMAAQSNLVVGLIESLTAQTQAWAELTQKLHTCCAAAVRDAAIETSERAALAGAQSDTRRPAGKEPVKRSAQD